MQYWYFLFEGIFKEGSPKNLMKGVFSSAMVPSLNEKTAEEKLYNALKAEGISLVEISDKFLFNPDDIDESADDNDYWISWYEEVVKSKRVVFTPWQVFEE